jgi:hypothetical protein
MSPPLGAPFPIPLDRYAAMPGAGLAELLWARVAVVPFNLVATGIFLLAVVHTFLAQRLRALAKNVEERHAAEADGHASSPSFKAEVLHFLGEVEVVFGLWAVALILAIAAFYGWGTAAHYLNDDVNYTEALFVVVIMALAATQPILVLAEGALRRVASLGGATPAAWWVTILTVGPLLGSFITEPAAMTICALLLGRQFYSRKPSRRLAYATLGLLFVNVSVGGTLTHFAAPPVLMVARPWGWDLRFTLTHFGGRAILGMAVANALLFLLFRKQLMGLQGAIPEAGGEAPATPVVPAWIIGVNLAFMAWTVANAHYPVLFVYGFLLFLGFAQATAPHQSAIDLKPPLLVGFFLAGLVVHGGLQGWWIAPVLERFATSPLYLGSVVLTSLNDNALITYLATLVPSLGPGEKYAVVAGAVTGGGLTVIANAPNPAGQALLGRYFEDGISPLGLLAGALVPTVVMAAVFLLT